MMPAVGRVGQVGRQGRASVGFSLLSLSSVGAFFDPEDAGSITLSGSLVTGWLDRKSGIQVTQGVNASRPAYSATSFIGRPGLTYDGNDDRLVATTGLGVLPSGALPGEIWALVNQTALPADTNARYIAGVGAGTSVSARRLQRAVSGGVNRAQTQVGNGSTLIGAQNATADFSGVQLVRAIIGATATSTEVDGVAGAPQAVVPGTNVTTLVIGATDALSGHFKGVLNGLLFTIGTPPADELLQIRNFFNARR